jgi:hypothetical protein
MRKAVSLSGQPFFMFVTKIYYLCTVFLARNYLIINHIKFLKLCSKFY